MNVSKKSLTLALLALVGATVFIWLGNLAAQPGIRPAPADAKKPAPEIIKNLPKELVEPIKDSSPSLLAPTDEMSLIDLASALNLAGLKNPQILLARERVLEATALRQLAAAQFLPSLHAGTSFNNHNGNLLPSNGAMLQVNRSSYYVGAGSMAIGSGTVSIPGVYFNANLSNTLFMALEARQAVRQRLSEERAVQNDMLLRVGLAYLQLVRAESRRAAAVQTLANADEVARLTAAFAKVGQGRESDADRAATERYELEAFLREAEGKVLIASARLAELLDLPPIPRLHPVEDRAVPIPAVPDPIPLPELLTIALANRPELEAQQAAIRQAFLALEGAKVLPFSPTIIVGLSYGAEGGGSNLVAEPVGTNATAAGAPRLSNLFERADFDAAVFWSLQNLGVGNVAMIKASRSHLASANFELVRRLNDVQAEVAIAYAKTHARLMRIESCERAIRAIQKGYAEDLAMIRGGQGLPIELVNSLDILARSRLAYVDAIMDYNDAQMELFVALGQPPADVLVRPVMNDRKP